MIRGCVLFAVFHAITAQNQFPPGLPPNIPQKCLAPPPVEKPHECCRIPAFFSDEDFSECGFERLDDSDVPKRRGPPDCSKQLCMLKKYDLLQDDEENVSVEAVKKFLDEWAEKNEEFKPAVDSARERCLGATLPGPPQICDANKIVFCVSSTMFNNCPTWQETEECTLVKDHMELCRPFFGN